MSDQKKRVVRRRISGGLGVGREVLAKWKILVYGIGRGPERLAGKSSQVGKGRSKFKGIVELLRTKGRKIMGMFR